MSCWPLCPGYVGSRIVQDCKDEDSDVRNGPRDIGNNVEAHSKLSTGASSFKVTLPLVLPGLEGEEIESTYTVPDNDQTPPAPGGLVDV